jgi:hypothetical protein
MSMKNWILLFLTIFSVIGINAQNTVINDPNAQVRDVKNFHGVEVSNAINLYLTQGNQEAVAVSARDTKYRDLIRTEVKNGILKIYLDKDSWNWHGGDHKLKAYVSIKTIDKLSGSGASDIMVDGTVSGDQLDLRLSGASDFKGAVKFNGITLDQSGASDVTISGSVNEISIEASGASNVKGYDLVTDNCKVHASGASDIRISVNKALSAHASGASSVYYKGTGVITDIHTSGASNITKKS